MVNKETQSKKERAEEKAKRKETKASLKSFASFCLTAGVIVGLPMWGIIKDIDKGRNVERASYSVADQLGDYDGMLSQKERASIYKDLGKVYVKGDRRFDLNARDFKRYLEMHPEEARKAGYELESN
jgi:hypothetical protein